MKKLLVIYFIFVVLFIVGLMITAFFSSTENKDYFNIETKVQGVGKIQINTERIERDSNKTCILTAQEDSPFLSWKIKGKCKIVNGSLTSKKIEIQPESNLTIIGLFEKNNVKSPQTEDITVTYVQLTLLCIICLILMFYSHVIK